MTVAFSGTSMPLYSQFIHLSRYSRWLDDEGRRETWDETVDRYIGFFKKQIDEHTLGDLTTEEWSFLRDGIYAPDVMPSMRCMMTAGKALERDNVAGYNCSYLPIDHPRAF